MTSLPEALTRLWQAEEAANMVQFDGRWFTWGHVRSLTERIDAELTAAGCSVGGRVAVVLDNRVESVATLLALIRGSRTLVTLSPLQPPERLSTDLQATKAGYVLAAEEWWASPDFAAAAANLGASGWSVQGVAVALRVTATHEAQPGNPMVAIEMLTSGTTGPPKRIPLTRAQLEVSLGAALQHNGRPEIRDKPPLTGSVALLMAPLVHIGGLFGLLQALASARPFVLLRRFTLPAWHAAITEHRPILVGLPPPAIRAVLDSDIPREDLASVRAVNAGTSPVDPVLVDAFLQRFGIPILIVYGATEFAGGVAGWTMKDFRAQWDDKKGSAGRAFPGVRLQVVDDDGVAVPAGETGRLQVASKQLGRAADEWVTTSDLAHIDEDGFLYIDGRADDVIVRGGFKVAPEAVVRSLRLHAAVSDGAVVGMPDERLGQIPIAAVELRSYASVTPEELREHCRASLTPYEVPAAIYIVDELPRGAAMKVDRRSLIEMLERLRVSAGGMLKS
jgi:acyl-CoA synthetase (AMP-forming)/AMP-acid ligase II